MCGSADECVSGDRMSRRVALANLLSLSIALGLAAGSALADQPARIWHVGVLVQEKRPASIESEHRFGAFAKELRRLGYIEGENLLTEWRFAEGVSARLPTLAAELVRLKVDVIVAATSPPTAAAQRATSTIPIVMASVGDPLGSGFVTNLARPDGNITGFSNLSGELGPMYLELLLTLVSHVPSIAVLINPANSTSGTILNGIQDAAQGANVAVVPIAADNPRAIDDAFSVMIHEHVGAFIEAEQRRQLIELARSQDRSVSSVIRAALAAHVEREYRDKAEPQEDTP